MINSKVHSSLLFGKSKEESDLIESSMKSGNKYIALLVDKLERELEAQTSAIDSAIKYDSPNWSLVVADNIGYRRCLRKVINILNPKSINNEVI